MKIFTEEEQRAAISLFRTRGTNGERQICFRDKHIGDAVLIEDGSWLFFPVRDLNGGYPHYSLLGLSLILFELNEGTRRAVFVFGKSEPI